MTDRTIRKKVEALKRQRLATKKVVNLDDFRQLKKNLDTKAILVVDDDELIRNAMKRVLEGEGHLVILASDGLELSKALESSRLDMIILDVNLPWVNGYELCRMIKSHYALKSVPLIMISGRRSQEDIENGYRAGADDYVAKPFDVEYIVELVNNKLLKLG